MDPVEMKLQASRMANMMYHMQQQQGGGAASTNPATPSPPQVTPTYVQQQQQWLYHQQQHYLQQQQQFYAVTSLANGSNDMSSLANQNSSSDRCHGMWRNRRRKLPDRPEVF